ncbi:hypothetical protein ABHI18_000692 [Aspergillus niger]
MSSAPGNHVSIVGNASGASFPPSPTNTNNGTVKRVNPGASRPNRSINARISSFDAAVRMFFKSDFCSGRTISDSDVGSGADPDKGDMLVPVTRNQYLLSQRCHSDDEGILFGD